MNTIVPNTLGICPKTNRLFVFLSTISTVVCQQVKRLLESLLPSLLVRVLQYPSSFVPHRIYNNLQKYPRYPCEQVIKMLLLLSLLYCKRYSKTILDCFLLRYTFSSIQATSFFLLPTYVFFSTFVRDKEVLVLLYDIECQQRFCNKVTFVLCRVQDQANTNLQVTTSFGALSITISTQDKSYTTFLRSLVI